MDISDKENVLTEFTDMAANIASESGQSFELCLLSIYVTCGPKYDNER